MTKIEVTDEMVRQAEQQAQRQGWAPNVDVAAQANWRSDMRAILDAALNGPEVVVTDAMVLAGENAYSNTEAERSSWSDCWKAAYRAMRLLEPK